MRARSKFWYFLRKLKKVKKSNGQIIAVNEIFEEQPTVRAPLGSPCMGRGQRFRVLGLWPCRHPLTRAAPAARGLWLSRL